MNHGRRSCTAVCSCTKEETCTGLVWARLKLLNMSTKSRIVTCVLSAIVMIAYVCLGSLLFTAVEQGNGESKKIETIKKILQNVNSLRNFSNTSVGRNFDDEEYISLLNDTYDVTLELLHAETLSYLPWNFFTGIHFCLTAITTIGYGYITPATQLGRGLCIPYVVIGIPINIFFSAKLAYFIAQGITKLYILLAKFTQLPFRQNRRQNALNQINLYEVDVMGEFSQRVDLHNDLQGTSGSVQYINDAFGIADEILSPKSEMCILREPHRHGPTINGTDLISHSLQSIQGANGTSKEALREAQQSEDEETLVPVWFMFVLLIAFCLLTSVILYTEEKESWTFLDSFYYVIITYTTVGFGDLSYKSSRDFKDYETVWWKMIYTFALMEIGLVIMAAFITLWADRFRDKVKQAKTSLHSARNSATNPHESVDHLANQVRVTEQALCVRTLNQSR